jgi:hypothetical protein
MCTEWSGQEIVSQKRGYLGTSRVRSSTTAAVEGTVGGGRQLGSEAGAKEEEDGAEYGGGGCEYTGAEAGGSASGCRVSTAPYGAASAAECVAGGSADSALAGANSSNVP